MENDNSGTMAATVSWLEVEQREAKDRLHRLQQSLEQMHSMLQDHAYRLQITEELGEALKFQSGKLPAIEEDLRQIKENTGHVQESQSDTARALERLERSKKSDEDATRDAIRGLIRSIEDLNATSESLADRNRSIDTTLKRQQEQMDWLKGQQEELRRGLDPVAQGLSSGQEQARRLQERLDQLAMALEPLRQQDEVIKSKLDVADHQARQIEQRLEALNTEFQSRRDLPERLDVQKINLDRVEKQSVQALQLIEKLSDAMERQGQYVRDLETRGKGQLDQILRLQQRSQEVYNRLDEILSSMGELLEQDKRRQITDMEGQFRGLKERLARMRGASMAASEESA
ncbi:MAG: hypothetical protein Q8R28_05135 [Dehalococcoidia bacterium]|nr:hypothetical protein [Dehalococcoidia bacterium]